METRFFRWIPFRLDPVSDLKNVVERHFPLDELFDVNPS